MVNMALLATGAGFLTASAVGFAYFIGKRRGMDEGCDVAYSTCLDQFCKFLNSDDGKDFMRHYVFAHELPYFVEKIGTEEALATARQIVEDYDQLATDTAAKQTVEEAEDILDTLGKED